MQHEAPPPHAGEHAAPSLLAHPAVLLAMWPSQSTDDRRALRLCSASMRDAVDAQAGRVEQGALSPCVLCPATCTRLHDVHTATLRSMDCLRRMLLVGPAGTAFPHLQSLRLHLVRTPSLTQRTAPYACAPDLGSVRLLHVVSVHVPHERPAAMRHAWALPCATAWVGRVLPPTTTAAADPNALHAATGRRVLRSEAPQTTRPSPAPLAVSPT
jgi:hypothetical protein